MRPEELSQRLLEFAARVGKVVAEVARLWRLRQLTLSAGKFWRIRLRMGNHVAGQLLRSGTSPGANYEEGCAAESRADFVHKLSICLKELRESRYWIRLVIKAELLPEARMKHLPDESTELCNIIAQSIITTKTKGRTRK